MYSASETWPTSEGTPSTSATSPAGTLGWPIPWAIAKPAKSRTKTAPKTTRPSRCSGAEPDERPAALPLLPWPVVGLLRWLGLTPRAAYLKTASHPSNPRPSRGRRRAVPRARRERGAPRSSPATHKPRPQPSPPSTPAPSESNSTPVTLSRPPRNSTLRAPARPSSSRAACSFNRFSASAGNGPKRSCSSSRIARSSPGSRAATMRRWMSIFAASKGTKVAGR